MDRSLTIGQLAKESGVTVKTIRYYEKIGLLLPTDRGANNYRYYNELQAYQLRFIRRAQGLGLTLSEIQELIELAREARCNDLRQALDEIFARKIREYELKLAALRLFRRQLAPERGSCACRAFVPDCDCLPSPATALT